MAAVLCPGCGGTVTVPEGHDRPRLRCPECGVACPVPAATDRPAPPRPARRPPSPAPSGPRAAKQETTGDIPDWSPPALPVEEQVATRPAEDEDDGSPYSVRPGEEERRCPGCARLLGEGETAVCVGCDYDLVGGRQAVRVWPRVETRWESGPAAGTRWRIFVGWGGAALTAAVLVGALSGAWVEALGPWLLGTALLAFITGTYFRCDLSRNPKGRVRLSRTWHVCFFRRPTVAFRLGDYDGACFGKVNEGLIWEWALLILFAPGVITGALWWYFVIHKDSFYVALTRDHGTPDEAVFRGWNEDKMHEVARLLREVAGLS